LERLELIADRGSDHGVKQLRVLVLRRVAVDVDEQIVIAVVGGLQRRPAATWISSPGATPWRSAGSPRYIVSTPATGTNVSS
jgi:hypothetical protein